jgi:hypothetical protein
MRTWKFGWMMFLTVVLLVSATPAIAQEHGDSGGGGCGDVFGDLIHVLRDDITGQPILAQRWIELPAEVPGYGWGYCQIAVTADGQEISFLPYTCDLDIDPESDNYVGAPVPVDYFGRLNGGRTKPRNNRMHFDEVISNIKAADFINQDPTGRLMMGFDCLDEDQEPDEDFCDWSTVDSPMESMGLYVRLMKFGHFQTDPFEVDLWTHGDPKLPVQYHPAFGPEDYAKFHGEGSHLLPDNGEDPWVCFDDVDNSGDWNPTEPYTDLETDEEAANGEYDLGEPFMDINFNGVRDDGGDTFVCGDDTDANPPYIFPLAESLDNDDFIRSASILAAAASKTGKVTSDLVQFWNRFLKVTKKNDYTGPSPLDTLPALYRDCWDNEYPPETPAEGIEVPDPDYLPAESCLIVEVVPNEPPNYGLFTDLKEQFVNFSALTKYKRNQVPEKKATVLVPEGTADTWTVDEEKLINWVELVNGITNEEENISGFVDAADDFLRMIEFIHNYDPPVDLYCTYETSECVYQ